MRWKCETCGKEYMRPDLAKDVIVARDYYWHVGCVTFYGKDVGFPSGGKLIPRHIVHEGTKSKAGSKA